ncbi:MAG: 5'-nucleotidase C-terminal domain-containing protein [Clostridia bacterium]|nr:5'-nucleotidase C-terminal domain-containing protein [Clostridia bacterium]
MRKILTVILALIMLLPIAVQVVIAENISLSDDIVILYTNDVHTYIDGPLSYDVIAAIKNELQSQFKNVLLVDAGDHTQGTAYGSMDKGKTIIELMNATGYNLATLGNHEFDYGMDGCINIREWAEFPYVSCNFYNENAGLRESNVLDSYVSFTCGDEIVAFIGITTPESFTKSTPAYFQNNDGEYIYGISGGEDGAALYADVQNAIDDAIDSGATKVIALGHLGDDDSSHPWTSEDTISNVSGLDAFIDGHSHSTVEGKSVTGKDGEDVLLTQTGSYFNCIGMMIIDDETGDITTDLIGYQEILDEDGETVLGYELVSDLYTETELISDAAIGAIKDAWIEKVKTELGAVIGSTSITLDNYSVLGERMVRTSETNTGDFCADALYYLFDSMGLDVDMAIMNGGGIRNQAINGDISYLTCKEIHPFGNVACLQTITGQQLFDALEWGARNAGIDESGGFLQVSGITYKINTSIPDTTQKDNKDVWIGGPTGEYRVYDVKVYDKESNTWEALNLSAKYNLAGYNYTLRELGDGFAMFSGAVNVLDYVMEDYMILANYVQAFEDSIVGATNSPLAAKYPGFTVDYSTINGSSRIEFKAASISDNENIIIGGLENDVWISKYGNVYTNCEVEDFFAEMGFAYGDVVTVRFLNQELTLPVVPIYSYVDSGSTAIIAGMTDAGEPNGNIALAINMGSFAETYGIAVKKTDEAGDWWWEAVDGVSFPVEITFELEQKAGYMSEYLLHTLSRTNNREDYTHLSDEEFANFRVIDTMGMGEHKLYRTSSPINPSMGRNSYADAALREAEVSVIMNLADSDEIAYGYEGFAETYYADQKVIFLNLGVDVSSDDFKTGLAKGLRFFAENEGIYAIHCTEGKDRAGFVAALLECFMGASYDEVIEDYMVTYTNYYGVEVGSEKYNAIAESNIINTLEIAFEVSDLSKADLAFEATEYIQSLGLSDSEIAKLKSNLGNDANPSTLIIILVCVVLAAVLLCGLIIFVRKRRQNKKVL